MIKKNIPNTITAANLFTGAVGVYFASQFEFEWVAFCIVLAAFFDFLDGMLARLLKVHSEIGKQLDSLADMVTFGFLPSYVLFQFLQMNDAGILSFTAFLIAVFSAFRLAKFNIDSRQSEEFIGLPTPANALFIGFLVFLKEFETLGFVFETPSLLIFAVVFSLLLVAEIPMIALKFKSLNFRENIFRYTTILMAIVLISFFQFSAVPLVILLYILLSVIKFAFNK
ncbi:CDP-diacylglycerol--serine O-phosphatidyltransferase [Marivirga harenae]|uniref:CDP-diacylglycerol--serine O-phosphatidyltransferase n=1 Tax=Marivirga harenae TaxID=2010992 RepID=UPI0026DFDACF|nr:CDP-diacylglycerol--serine O-phosphatidyltransferase [Marivirga harenae]WKV12841.1 CDP-diacylglycerol--serine O-phosphatidyltransferase [Marivirga harenae]|tara:strand:+ start:9774 stop:10451 length:678 start_codon:yes stop_codon:yes gene_type:complete